MRFDKEEYYRVMNIPLSVIIASFITIIITTGITNTNGLNALIGGYIGLLLGILFILIINYQNQSLLDLFPFISIIMIIGLLLHYFRTYYHLISSGEVSSYYSSFSTLSTIFLVVQIMLLFKEMYNASTREMNGPILTNSSFALLGLLAVINGLIVITLGIVLHFYSTQG
jgi:hypothetical protein